MCVLISIIMACSSKNDKYLHVNLIDEGKNSLYFELFNERNEYWAHFIIYDDDKTIAYTANSGVKFRTDITDFQYLKYQKNDDGSESGKLHLKWKNESEKFYVTDMETKDWKRIKNFTSDWAEQGKFIP